MRIIIKFLYKILSKIIYRVEVKGKENLPKEEAAIICPNHVHFLDGPTLIANSKRKINVLAKEELFKNKFLSNCLRMLGMYPIKRGSADIEAIKVSLKILKNNELLMIFPEGTRNGMAKGVKPKNGAVVISNAIKNLSTSLINTSLNTFKSNLFIQSPPLIYCIYYI